MTIWGFQGLFLFVALLCTVIKCSNNVFNWQFFNLLFVYTFLLWKEKTWLWSARAFPPHILNQVWVKHKVAAQAVNSDVAVILSQMCHTYLKCYENLRHVLELPMASVINEMVCCYSNLKGIWYFIKHYTRLNKCHVIRATGWERNICCHISWSIQIISFYFD